MFHYIVFTLPKKMNFCLLSITWCRHCAKGLYAKWKTLFLHFSLEYLRKKTNIIAGNILIGHLSEK